MDSHNADGSNGQYSLQERNMIIGFLVDHTTGLVVNALRRREKTVRANPTNAELRARFEELLDAKELVVEDLVDIQTELEGWGKQQIYLFQCKTSERILKSTWYSRAWVERHLREVESTLILDERNPLALPESPQLIAVYYSEDYENPKIRFVWAQKLISRLRDTSLDSGSEDFESNDANILERIIFQGYRETLGRGIISFDWEIGSGQAMLLIHKLSERDYKPMRKRIMRDLNDLFTNVDFEWLDIRPAMANRDCLATFDDDIEVVFPRHDVPTTDGNRIALFHEHQKSVSEDSELAEVQERQQTVFSGYKLDLRWKPRARKEFRVELLARLDDDQRIGIGAQRTEKEIRDVIRGIRFCL